MGTTLADQIGPILRDWRESEPRPLTRDQVAEASRRCAATIRNWENGRQPRIVDIFDLERVKPGLVRRIFGLFLRSRPRRPKRRNGAAIHA